MQSRGRTDGGGGGGGYCAEIRKGQGIDNNQHRGFT